MTKATLLMDPPHEGQSSGKTSWMRARSAAQRETAPIWAPGLAPALAAERYQELVAAVGAAGPPEAVGEDAAPQVGPEVALGPSGNAGAGGITLCGLRQERLEVVLNEWVEGCPRGLSTPMDRGAPRRHRPRVGGKPGPDPRTWGRFTQPDRRERALHTLVVRRCFQWSSGKA